MQVFVMNERLANEQEMKEQLSHEVSLLRKQVQHLEDDLQSESLLRRSLHINLQAALDHLLISTKLLADENEKHHPSNNDRIATPRLMEQPLQHNREQKIANDSPHSFTNSPTFDDKLSNDVIAVTEQTEHTNISNNNNNTNNNANNNNNNNNNTTNNANEVSMSSQADELDDGDDDIEGRQQEGGREQEEEGQGVEGEGFIDFLTEREEESEPLYTPGEVGEMEPRAESGPANGADRAEPIDDDDDDDGVEFFV